MRQHFVSLLVLVVGEVFVTTSTANVGVPSRDVVTIDATFTPPELSASWGLTVTRHVKGHLTVRTFYDEAGEFVRELDQYHLVETVSANGKTLTGHTSQNIFVQLQPNEFYTVAIVGTDFLLLVPGAGMAFGSVGRLVMLFAPDNTLIEVQQDVGNADADFSAICAALAP